MTTASSNTALRIVGVVVRTMFKAALALAVFSALVGGWWLFQFRQAEAFARSLPLPNHVRQDGCAIWFVGSSSMSRWETLQRDMEPWTAHNRAIPGATLEEISTRFFNERNPQVPEAIVFYAGENDIAFGNSAQTVAAQFASFMQGKTARMGQVPVYFMTVKPSPTRWDDRGTQAAYVAAVRRLAAGRKDLVVVDTASRFLIGGRPGPFYKDDGIHLNDQGYRIWSSRLRDTLGATMPASLVRRCSHLARI